MAFIAEIADMKDMAIMAACIDPHTHTLGRCGFRCKML